MSRQSLLRFLRVALGVGLLALLCTRVKPSELALLLRHANAGEVALALALLFLANPILQTLRLHVLVARFTQSVWTSFEVYSVGSFFNLMLPSNVGGDAVKLLYLKRMRAESWAAPFVLLLLHRFTGMIALLLGAGCYVLADHTRLLGLMQHARVEAHVPTRALEAAALLILLLAFGWLVLAPRHRTAVAGVARRFSSDCGQALAMVGARAASELVLLTLAFHFVRMLAFYFLVRATGQEIALLDLLIVLAATAVAGVLPLSVGGLGLMEGAVSITLGWFGVSATAALVAALANRVVLLAGAGIGGLFYLAARKAEPQAP